ncbi:MAG: hypothetical protein ACFHXK_04695 [bacterium]
MPNQSVWIKGLVSVVLIVIVTLSWSGQLDHAARAATFDNFQRALAVAAIARGFNGVISVAQGTEVAIAPVGVGVTLTLGEILDPLNDLVERFSALALLASVALGVQLTLSDMFSSPWLSGILSAAALSYLILLWRAPHRLQQASALWLGKFLGLLIFFRFMLAVMLLATHLLDTWFLDARQNEAIDNLTYTRTHIQNMQDSQVDISPADREADLFDRTAAGIRDFLDSSSQTLDLKAQFSEMEQQVENSIEEMINLIVIFLLQTLLLPIATLWLCWQLLRRFWRTLEP